MVKIRLIFLLSIVSFSLHSQDFAKDSTSSVIHSLKTEIGALISAKSTLPFWLKANNSGRFSDQSANSIYNILDYKGAYNPVDNIKIKWQLESVLNVREQIQGRFIQANIGFETNFLSAHAGYKEESFGLNDSTLSIGNLVYGNNARPIPKFVISTNGWQKTPFLKNALSFQAYLAHGKFEKNRFQSGAFLHQKYFYLKITALQERLSLIGGLNHNAQWGGDNVQNESSQPTGFKNFAKIFTGSSGGDDALLTDQQNALGNHLGSYDLKGSMLFKNLRLTNYWQFLWEDKSGLTPFNWRDGLMGISIDLINQKVINKVVLEIVRTNNQNAQKIADDGTPIFEPDNFFNNGVYRSGWSYHDQVIGNPIFILLNPESTSVSRIKNSINAVNIGFQGKFSQFAYEIRYIDFKNKGTKQEIISPSLRIRAIDIRINYRFGNYSWIGSRINYQHANFGSQRNFGIQLSYSRTFDF